jgi:Tfp pilus assembly ATPase PilU
MPAPQTFKELQDWLKGEIIKMTAAANRAVDDGNMTYDQAMVVHAENVAMITSKALNRALELLDARYEPTTAVTEGDDVA